MQVTTGFDTVKARAKAMKAACADYGIIANEGNAPAKILTLLIPDLQFLNEIFGVSDRAVKRVTIKFHDILIRKDLKDGLGVCGTNLPQQQSGSAEMGEFLKG